MSFFVDPKKISGHQGVSQGEPVNKQYPEADAIFD